MPRPPLLVPPLSLLFLLAWVGLASAQDPRSAPILPDPKLTPGATFDVSEQDVCVPGYAKRVRNVTADVKRQVYQRYGIVSHRSGDYEVDHLVPLTLGGNNTVENLWPQSRLTSPWNAQVKDALEFRLHEMLCRHQIDLKAAQQAIARNWIDAYKTYVSPQPQAYRGRRRKEFDAVPDTTVERPAPGSGAGPAPAPPSASGPGPAAPGASAPPSGQAAQVWVNTRSGKYFKPGARYYGTTKEGRYMSEADAQRAGYQPAGGTGLPR